VALAHSPKIVTDGLVLCLDAGNTKSYPGSGTDWSDLSGNGNNGSLTNGPTYSSDDGGSIVFDGSDDHVTFTSNPSLTDQITIEVWVKLNSTSATNGWICGRERSYRLLYASNSFGWVCATDNNDWYTTGTFIGAGSVAPHTNTYQVVVTYDGSNNKIYVNGTLRNTASSISGNIKDVNNPYYIMRDGANVGDIDYGKGNLYSHKLYNRALTASEVAQNYNALRGRFGI